MPCHTLLLFPFGLTLFKQLQWILHTYNNKLLDTKCLSNYKLMNRSLSWAFVALHTNITIYWFIYHICNKAVRELNQRGCGWKMSCTTPGLLTRNLPLQTKENYKNVSQDILYPIEDSNQPHSKHKSIITTWANLLSFT